MFTLSGPLPNLESLEALSLFFEVRPEFLRSVRDNKREHYREFSISKRRGGLRLIRAPKPTLRSVQSKIYEEILSRVILDDAAHGFVFNRSIVSNASIHLKGRDFLHLDIQDFFPSIPIERVIIIFRDLGYSLEMAQLLAELCTLDQVLPQGAPSSPAISNICAIEMDRSISLLCKEIELSYSRYSDDITISGHRISLHLEFLVRTVVERNGFRLNAEKTLLARNRGKHLVTGISVSRGVLKIPRRTKRKIRQQAFFLVKNDVLQESNKKGFDPFYVDRVLGKLSFWKFVEPDAEFPRRIIPMIVEKSEALANQFRARLATRER